MSTKRAIGEEQMGKYVLIVSTDDGSAESGNTSYCDYLVFDSKEEACSSARKALSSANFEETESDGEMHFVDEYDNWLHVVPASVSIHLQNTQQDRVYSSIDEEE